MNTNVKPFTAVFAEALDLSEDTEMFFSDMLQGADPAVSRQDMASFLDMAKDAVDPIALEELKELGQIMLSNKIDYIIFKQQ